MPLTLVKNGSNLTTGIMLQSDFAPEAFECLDGELVPTVITDGVTIIGDGASDVIASTDTSQIWSDAIINSTFNQDITSVGTVDTPDLTIAYVNSSATRSMAVHVDARCIFSVQLNTEGMFDLRLQVDAVNSDNMNLNTKAADLGGTISGDLIYTRPYSFIVAPSTTTTIDYRLRIETTDASTASSTWFGYSLRIAGISVMV